MENPEIAGSGALSEWLGPLEDSRADVDRLYELQAPTLEVLKQRSTCLPEDFVARVMQYSVLGSTFCRRMMEPEARFDRLPFRVSNFDLLLEERQAGRCPLLLLSHTGMWNSIALWTGRIGVPFAVLIEQMPDDLVELYRAQGVDPIVARPPIVMKLAGGRTVRLLGTDSLSLVKEALGQGKIVCMFADAYRKNGVRARLLGVDVRIIQHYAVVAVQVECPLFVLRHWTTNDALHIDFERIDTRAGDPRKLRRVYSIVEQYVRVLSRHLDERPEQFAYIPPNLFLLSSAAEC